MFNRQTSFRRTRITVSVSTLIGAIALLAGCASSSERNLSKAGPQGLFSEERPVSSVDLLALVSGATLSDSSEPKRSREQYVSALDGVLAKLSAQERDARRNVVLDRLIVASNDLCEEYKTVLKRKQANANFNYGAAAVLFGASRAISGGVHAAKNFAALSGISSGLRAEHNQSHYSDMAAHVIVKGINRRRDNILSGIIQARTCSARDYSVEMAIADAVAYHGACSLVGGLEQADVALGGLRIDAGIDALAANRFFAPHAVAAAASAASAAAAASTPTDTKTTPKPSGEAKAAETPPRTVPCAAATAAPAIAAQG